MDNVLWSAGAYIVAIGVLVTFHEFGHFWVARRLGVKVLRFSIGFGPALWKRVARDGVEYVVAWIPLGGYVKMLDEREGDVAEADLPRAFNRQKLWRRAAIVFAGPFFNFILAVIFYWLVWVAGVPGIKPVIAAPASGTIAAGAGLRSHDEIVAVDGKAIHSWADLRTSVLSHALDGEAMHLKLRTPQGQTGSAVLDLSHVRVAPRQLFADVGLRPYQPPIPPVLREIEAGGPAQAAGFKPGDRLRARGSTPVTSWQQWVRFVRANPNETVSLHVERGTRTLTLPLTLGQASSNGKTIGHFGAGVEVPVNLWHDLRIDRRLGVFAALPAGLQETWEMSLLTLELGYRVVIGDISLKNIAGPIRTAEAAGYSARIGWVAFLSFLAFVSVNLGIVNLLPVPMLDGGHLLYYVVEAVRGTPLSDRTQALGQQLGLTLLVLLIGVVFYNDIASLMS